MERNKMIILNHRDDAAKDVCSIHSFSTAGSDNGDKQDFGRTYATLSSKHSETGNGSSSGSDDEREVIRSKLAKKGSGSVTALWFSVIVILILSAASISFVVFMITSNAENDDFETLYNGAASKILESFEAFDAKIASVTAMKTALTSEGMGNRRMNSSSTTSWPFVTLLDFHYRSSTAKLLAGALQLIVQPIVTDEHRKEWETYCAGPAKEWIAKGLEYQSLQGFDKFEVNPPPLDEVLMKNISSQPIVLWNDSGSGEYYVHPGPGPYFPHWQANPVLRKQRINEDEDGEHAELVMKCAKKEKVVLTGFEIGKEGTFRDKNETIALWATLRSFQEGREEKYLGSLGFTVHIPVFDTFDSPRKVVAVLHSHMRMSQFLENVLPENVRGITVVVENTCYGNYTYQVDGFNATGLGLGDLHDKSFDRYKQTTVIDESVSVSDGTPEGIAIDSEDCFYRFHVYPSSTFSENIITKTPLFVTFSVAMVFLFSISLFVVYSIVVERRQKMVLSKAVHSTAIVSSMFPKQVRDRLLEEEQEKPTKKVGSYNLLKSFLNEDDTGKNALLGGTQIADLYTQCTVMFADIAGFTAWSSTRGPDHVFILLQTIYHGFDVIAKRRKVFKVETIGDCYLAATGLPEPQPMHAVIMARFVWECKQKLNQMTRELEVSLGPDCSELRMRFGIHSGPVTAGVLRGDRARFQLFGDTVNTASRMESTGMRDKVQITHATADLLVAAGKEHWITPRSDVVEAKGKGTLQTYWLDPSKAKVSGVSISGSTSDNTSCDGSRQQELDSPKTTDLDKHDRLIEWMMELLLEKIRHLKAKQIDTSSKSTSLAAQQVPKVGGMCLDEVVEVIPMSKYVSAAEEVSVEVPESIVNQLRDYIAIIAQMYCRNPFHNFEHACHVTMSVSKLLKRIVSPDLDFDDMKDTAESNNKISSHLHNLTYGIHSDALAQFAIVFSALIHDVDHRGCSNAQLIKENGSLASRYGEKSVAEQNSLDLSWNLLLSDQFESLRAYIFSENDELLRFRQLIINTVLATDIFDKELAALRKARWERAFSAESDNDEHQLDRKATIVIEHIIQASDVAHTMQHWQIYTKWNKLLFTEMYQAYKAGRMAVNPLTFWYKGEISFFDNYVIPLAKKLKECNVFGVSSDEYLNYAVSNRNEWEVRGESVVEELAQMASMYDDDE